MPSFAGKVFNMMNQQALSTVILRLLGLSYTYRSITGFFSSNMLMQAMSLNDVYGEERISLFAVVWGMIGIHVLFGIVLMLFAGKFSALLFRGDEAVGDGSALGATALLRAGVPLLGVYFLVRNLPYFITTSIAWFRENAAPSGMPPQHGSDMAHVTIILILSLILILKSDSLCRVLRR